MRARLASSPESFAANRGGESRSRDKQLERRRIATQEPRPWRDASTLAQSARHRYQITPRTPPTTRTVPRGGEGRCLSHSRDSLPHRSRTRSKFELWNGMATLARAAAPMVSSTSRFLITAVLVALLCLSPVDAVRIPFQNCLPDSYRFNDPLPLQWVPLYADAVFDTHHETHNLQVIVWANVSGSQNQGSLPPANSPYWTDDSQTNGKIIESANPDSPHAVATTLYRKVNVLTYNPWNKLEDFCRDGLVNGSCPLSPVFDTKDIDIPYGLPSSNLSHDFFSSYAFSSFSTTFLVIYGDLAATNIGCFSATITPSLGSLGPILKFLPLLVLLLIAFAVPFASIFSPWGTMDVFHWTSNYGRDADLLRLVTPGFGDCLQYIQFIALSGGLTLSYPGFFQPIVSQVGWSALMFNQTFVGSAPPWQSVVDGIYVTNGTYGLQNLGQLIGMAQGEDIWPSMMVWLLSIILGVFVLIQIGFFGQWLYRNIQKTPEEDLRAKNIPFTVGNIVRMVFNYFLLPIVALSSFQFVVAVESPAYTVALAAVTLALVIGFAAWLLWLIIKTKPKSVLFDDLPTVLQYGPLYNTYSDELAAFALIPMLLTFIRGLTIGAVQPSGVAQVVLLAICEVIQLLALHAFRPFQSPTSMNAYHTIFSALRLTVVLLMLAFIPTLGVTEGPKGWIGYAILLVHGIVLVLGFFLNALQTIVEVVARMLGAGGDDVRGLTRGGLSKIFGMRQLSRRVTPREGPSRASQLSTTGMLDAEGSKTGYTMQGSRMRSESAASIGAMAAHPRQRSSSALDSIDLYSGTQPNMETASSYLPGTPGGDASTYSFMSAPLAARQRPQTMPLEAADPYYRPPRRRRETLTDSIHSDRGVPATADPRQQGQAPGQLGDQAEMGGEISRGATPAPPGAANAPISPPNRPDYSTREVDFYYGVRGPALNSDGPGRKLGTGPADPTGPMATATGFFRTFFGGKTKDKSKGFEVVRSSRMPPSMMAPGGGFGDETPPEGIPVAMGVLRNGPIDSDDDDEPQIKQPEMRRVGDLLTDSGDPQDSEPESPIEERRQQPYRDEPSQGPEIAVTGAAEPDESGGEDDEPTIPRKSSKRNSAMMEQLSHTPTLSTIESRSPRSADHSTAGEATGAHGHPATSTLPFESSGSQGQVSSSSSSMAFSEDLAQIVLHGGEHDGRPESVRSVPHHGINRVDPVGLNIPTGSSAEVVDESAEAQQK